jgi:AcrR family transcriptional regulator
MGRPPIIRDEDLLEAARAVFLEKGLRATTAEVASRAGVSEGSIFKRFKSKAELFKAAMGIHAHVQTLFGALQSVPTGDGRQALVHAGMRLVEHFRQVVPLVVMSMSAHASADEVPEELKGPNPMPAQGILGIAHQMQAWMDEGLLRRTDALALARCFSGSIWQFVYMEAVLEQSPLSQPADEYVAGLVDLLWNGIAPEGARGS